MGTPWGAFGRFGRLRVNQKNKISLEWPFFGRKTPRMTENVQKNFLFIFLVNPLTANQIEKYVIFDTFFLTRRTIAYYSMGVFFWNLLFTTETLKQMDFQEIWSY